MNFDYELEHNMTVYSINPLPASSELCHLLIDFVNSLDSDQDPNRLTL